MSINGRSATLAPFPAGQSSARQNAISESVAGSDTGCCRFGMGGTKITGFQSQGEWREKLGWAPGHDQSPDVKRSDAIQRKEQEALHMHLFPTEREHRECFHGKYSEGETVPVRQ